MEKSEQNLETLSKKLFGCDMSAVEMVSASVNHATDGNQFASGSASKNNSHSQSISVDTDASVTARFEKQLLFIAEIDKIKLILRRTLLTDSSRRENDAEHSWHLAMMAILLEEYATAPVDMRRVLTMVIIHDLVEIYAGDTFAFDAEGNKDKEEREKLAADKLFGILPEDQAKSLRPLWEEFDRMDTADSQFAASLDRLQPFIHNVLTDGHTWKLGNVTLAQVYKRMELVNKWLPAAWNWVEAQIQAAVSKGWIRK